MMGGKTCFKDDYICNTVFGNSMLVDGIHSGWGLLMKPAGNKRIKSGDFIVINVDGGYYRYRHQDKTPLFQKKLRRAIGEIKSDSSVESIFSMLSGTFAEPLDSRDREDLTDSLNDARTYYADSKTLFLSVTYHDSDIHYSFHPSGSIKYWVEGVAFRNDKGIEYKTTEELQ